MTRSLEDLASPHLTGLIPYSPGKPIEEVERELGISDSVKLASNENPLGPSPKALQAIAGALPNLHRYPDGGGYALRQALSRHWGVPADWLILGNGSNELLDMVGRSFLMPGDEVLYARQAFIEYHANPSYGDGREGIYTKFRMSGVAWFTGNVLRAAHASPRLWLRLVVFSRRARWVRIPRRACGSESETGSVRALSSREEVSRSRSVRQRPTGCSETQD